LKLPGIEARRIRSVAQSLYILFFFYIYTNASIQFTHFCYKFRSYWKIFSLSLSNISEHRNGRSCWETSVFDCHHITNHQSTHLRSRQTDGQARAYAAFQSDCMFGHSAGSQFWRQLSPAPSFSEQDLLESVIWLAHDTCC